MSTYNGEDIFGSGGHRIIWDQDETVNAEFSFPGFHGVFSRNQGTKKRTGRIRGQIRGANVVTLNAAIDKIERYIGDGGAYTLHDNFEVDHLYVRLDRFMRTNRMLIGRTELTETFIQEYEVSFTAMEPFSTVTT